MEFDKTKVLTCVTADQARVGDERLGGRYFERFDAQSKRMPSNNYSSYHW